jgi:hypothetical protein
MKNLEEKREISDIDKIIQFLIDLEFTCQSQPSSQNLIYSKKGNIIIIKNNRS